MAQLCQFDYNYYVLNGLLYLLLITYYVSDKKKKKLFFLVVCNKHRLIKNYVWGFLNLRDLLFQRFIEYFTSNQLYYVSLKSYIYFNRNLVHKVIRMR